MNDYISNFEAILVESNTKYERVDISDGVATETTFCFDKFEGCAVTIDSGNVTFVNGANGEIYVSAVLASIPPEVMFEIMLNFDFKAYMASFDS